MIFSENFLYHIWDGQHISNILLTKAGTKLEIIYQGRWNTGKGPDFKDAVIRIEHKVIKGDIEIEKSCYNWHTHKHDENPEYNRVILHVVYESRSKSNFTINEEGERIEILTLQNYLSQDIKKLLTRFTAKYSPTVKHCNFFGGLSNDQLISILGNLARTRLERKMKRFAAEHYFNDLNQILYQGIMEALGYSRNKFQMLLLASELNINKLKEYYLQGMNLKELTAIFLCATGLNLNLTPQVRKNLNPEEIYNKQEYYIGTIDLKWDLFRIRPANHPANRLIQIAPLIFDSLSNPLLYKLQKCFSFAGHDLSIGEMKKRLFNIFNPDDGSLFPCSRIGKQRIWGILINIFIPVLILFSQNQGFKDLEKSVLKVYFSFSGLEENRLIRAMKPFLLDSQYRLINSKAHLQQAIIYLYYRYCQHHNCDLCKNNRSELLAEM